MTGEGKSHTERLELFLNDEIVHRGPFGKDDSHLLKDLDIPALELTESHDRTMGFWVVNWIHLVKDSLRIFFKNGGTIRLIIGVPSSKESYRLLIEAAGQSGSPEYMKIVRNQFLQKLDNPSLWVDTKSADLFLESVLSGRLEIKLRPENPEDEAYGAHPEHSKVRIFRLQNHIYTLSGSANDTLAAIFGMKEYSATADVTWSPDPSVVRGAEKTLMTFEKDWVSQHSVNLDPQAIEILKNLQRKYQSNGMFEDDLSDSAVKKWHDLIDKLSKKNTAVFFIFEPDRELFDSYLSSRPEEFESGTFESIILSEDDNLDLYTFTIFCKQRNVKYSIFVNNHDSRVMLEKKEGIYYETGIYTHSDLLEKGKEISSKMELELPENYQIWCAIFEIYQFEIPEINIEIEEETSDDIVPSNDYWDNNLFQYLYDKVPGDLKPHNHQTKALDAWIENDYRGIFQHATGTYKTATGLCAAAHLLSTHCNLVIISTPYTAVSEQWYREAKRCFNNVILVPCWSDPEYTGWNSKLDISLKAAIESDRKVLAIFVEASLFGLKKKKNLIFDKLASLSQHGKKWGLIADEMHNWITHSANPVSFRFMNELDSICDYRLGLSAKIDIIGFEEHDRNLFVKSWFATNIETSTQIIDTFTLERAINEGYLRKYEYEVVPIKVFVPENYLGKDADIKTIRHAIYLFYKGAKEYAIENAFDILNQVDTERLLIYTGPTVEIAEELVTDIKSKQPWDVTAKVKKFTSHESSAKRKVILDEFKWGRTKILVSIKCLDEGVNLPIADTAIMVESAAADNRQWIQRRGRILRRVGKEEKNAKIIDFHPIFEGAALTTGQVGNVLQQRRESSWNRIQEFIGTAELKSRLTFHNTWRRL